MRQYLAQIVSYDSARGRRGEVQDLEDLFLEVELLGGAVVGVEPLNVSAQTRYEVQEEQVLLLCGQCLELG